MNSGLANKGRRSPKPKDGLLGRRQFCRRFQYPHGILLSFLGMVGFNSKSPGDTKSRQGSNSDYCINSLGNIGVSRLDFDLAFIHWQQKAFLKELLHTFADLIDVIAVVLVELGQ